MKSLILKAYGKENKIYLGISNYTSNNNLAIEMYSICEDEDGDYLEPWGIITKNLTPYTLAEDTAFVDTNNMPYIEDFIRVITLANLLVVFRHLVSVYILNTNLI